MTVENPNGGVAAVVTLITCIPMVNYMYTYDRVTYTDLPFCSRREQTATRITKYYIK